MQIIPFLKSSVAPGIAQYMQKSPIKRYKEALLITKWPILDPDELLELERKQKIDRLRPKNGKNF